MNVRKCNRIAAVAAIGFAAGAFAPWIATAAVIDVVVAGTGTKTATIREGESVAVEIFVSDMPANGLGFYAVSLRSFNEQAGGAPWPVPRTALNTVVNATASISGNGDVVLWDLLLQNGMLVDLAAPNPPLGPGDSNDTDLDVRAIGGLQGEPGFTQGIAQGGESYRIGQATFSALDLDDASLPFPRTVNLNTFKTQLNGSNGGLILRRLNDDNSLVEIPLDAISIGADVLVTVVPEPSTTALLGVGSLALVLWWQRRRISARD